MTVNVFKSYLMGGFECSTHRALSGRRIDVIDATRHDELARLDYERLIEVEIRTARDGTRWHLIEKTPFQYDFSSVIRQIRAARETNLQVIWDLFHYGFPDDLDIFSEEFIERFTCFAEKFIELLIAEGDTKPFICLINEISFFVWAAGEVGFFYPFVRGRGDELKRHLVKATIAAAEKIREIAPQAVLIQTDPAIRVAPSKPENKTDAANYHESQFQALDMTLGKTAPELGGAEDLIDIIGVNYYSNNQWRHPSGRRIWRGQKNYQPFSEILQEFYERYKKPLFIAETGIENAARPDWFRYVCEEARIAERNGVPILGICLYPIVSHPGWDDNRHCYNGLWDYPNERGEREIYLPLAEEIARQTIIRNNERNKLNDFSE